jgi:hypothetical protein
MYRWWNYNVCAFRVNSILSHKSLNSGHIMVNSISHGPIKVVKLLVVARFVPDGVHLTPTGQYYIRRSVRGAIYHRGSSHDESVYRR